MAKRLKNNKKMLNSVKANLKDLENSRNGRIFAESFKNTSQ